MRTCDTIASSFSKDPTATTQQIVQSLQPAERTFLLEALKADTLTLAQTAQSTARSQASSAGVPQSAVLFSVALSTGLPFIVFGFSDNAIMIVAGDEIESMFGARLGISTLAAAGLGNLISDVIGLGMAEPVQARMGRWLKVKPLTVQQTQLWQTRAARFSGSSLGISIGCLLGMTPLLFMKPKEKRTESA
ncbi:g7365 [Coccomyxa elongata]